MALVSLDIVSMYNNMTDELGKSAAREYLESRNLQGEDRVSTENLLKCLDLCLDNNYFEFNKKMYRQSGGVGTGIKLAPPYACLGVGKFEQTVFNPAENEFLEQILLWKRFIDDILMLFKGSKEDCQNFVDWLNSLLPGVLQFKYEYSVEKLQFLD